MTGCGGDSPDVTVAINRSGAARTVNIPAADGGYTDLLNPGGAPVPGGSVEVPPRGALILRSPSPR